MRAIVIATWVLLAGCEPSASPSVVEAGALDGGADFAGCATSCDCPTGQTCAGAMCIAGIIDVYCCSSERCPTGAVCQAPNGEVSICGGASAPARSAGPH
ncbi:MAG: hypothetical protein JWM53_1147 [bacterium]|nr:hypothetical protein [bacterium]